jgi:hypothetical protein
MTFDEVQSLVSAQSAESLSVINDHRMKLEQAIVSPQEIPLIFRTVVGGRVKDERLNAWLVGQENTADGYRIVMREDGKQFGLASVGFSHDKHLCLVGWYGTLLSAFLAM